MAVGLKGENKRVRTFLAVTRSGIFATGCLLSTFLCFAQCPSASQLAGQLSVLQETRLSDAEKLSKALPLQKNVERCSLPKDSVYARLLHWMGRWAFGSGHPNEAIAYTQQAAKINAAKNAAANPQLALNSYYNLGYYSQRLRRYQTASSFYDSCIRNAGAFNDSATRSQMVKARAQKTQIYFATGDYAKAIEEASLGIQTAKAIRYRPELINLLNARAQSYAALSQINEAKADANEAASIIGSLAFGAAAKDARAYNFRVQADISEADGKFPEAMAYHQRVIEIYSLLKDTVLMADGYLNAGQTVRKQTLLQRGTDFSSAKNFYAIALALAGKVNYTDVIIKALNNLAAVSFRAKAFAEALQAYHNSLLQAVPVFKSPNPTENPSHNQCYGISDKNFLSTLLANKAECLLNLYKQSGNKSYLSAALKTALLTDSVITDMRREQTGDQSKLYWRNETREFFTNALEICYSANDAARALYFMEKSRAVLLNDKLTELGAAAQLPPAEAAREQALQNNVFALQQQLAKLAGNDPAYDEAQLKLITAKDALANYIQTLQAKFTAYYQYKYADAAPSLPQLQTYLAANKQSFADYFISDTAVYTLLVTLSSASIQKQRSNHLAGELSLFLQTCSNPQLLNNQYPRFAAQAYALYRVLIKPLALPKGRVIVCSDGLVIPFEALTTGADGRTFLINDYSFSYVYSAQTLLKKFSNPSGDGNFLGMAPVSYAARLSVPPLQGSCASLQASSAFYSGNKLFCGADAGRSHLLTYLPRYNVVAILSHARADSADKEPILFMADSIIRLSELQLLRHPSTKLVVLSACQTNAGKLATGEGVFSLARGFSAAGIPAVTATVWKADEGAIYAITKTFLQNIAAGMRKDEALQAAKLAYLQTGSGKNALPYFWANMIVVGNAESVALATKTSWGWWAGSASIIVAVLASLLFLRRSKHRTAA